MARSQFNETLIGINATFSIGLVAVIESPPGNAFDLMDGVIVFLIFSSVVLLTSTASYFINRAQHQRRRVQLRQIEMRNVPSYPPPEMHQYAFDLQNLDRKKNKFPISLELFDGHGQYKMQATSFVILMPGTSLYLAQGDLPKFGIGTRIIQTKKKVDVVNSKINDK
jgi:hypothetical protein